MKASELRKLADRENRKSSRRKILEIYRKLKKFLKAYAKKGEYIYDYSFQAYSKEGAYTLAAFRFLRYKHRDLKVEIRGVDYDGCEPDSFWDSDKIKVKVKF